MAFLNIKIKTQTFNKIIMIFISGKAVKIWKNKKKE